MRISRILLIGLAVVVSFLSEEFAEAAQCEYRRTEHVEQLSWKSKQNHKRGSHRAKAVADFTCICDHTCRSRASVAWRSTSCEDSGRVRGLKSHREYRSGTLDTSSIPNATGSTGASAAAAFACYVEECFPGQCNGISISIKGQPLDVGVGAVFSGRPMPFDGQELGLELACDPCMTSRQVTAELMHSGKEYVPYDEGDYGSGSGSVYKSCYWECVSWINSEGVFQEVCELQECLIF